MIFLNRLFYISLMSEALAEVGVLKINSRRLNSHINSHKLNYRMDSGERYNRINPRKQNYRANLRNRITV